MRTLCDHAPVPQAEQLGGLLGEHLHGSGLQMTAVSASLEDAFIYLMQGSQDQFRG